MKHDKHKAKYRSLLIESNVPYGSMQAGVDKLLDPNMDHTSAEDALDSQLAYYKASLSCIGREVRLVTKS